MTVNLPLATCLTSSVHNSPPSATHLPASVAVNRRRSVTIPTDDYGGPEGRFLVYRPEALGARHVVVRLLGADFGRLAGEAEGGNGESGLPLARYLPLNDMSGVGRSY